MYYLSKSAKRKLIAIDEKDVLHPPGVEPGPIAWKAIILPLDQECLMKEYLLLSYIYYIVFPKQRRFAVSTLGL
jgi:hypothetical protein